MAVDAAADAGTGRTSPANPAWRARWLIIARRAWPVVTVLAITANLLVLPGYTRSLLTHTVRSELPPMGSEAYNGSRRNGPFGP